MSKSQQENSSKVQAIADLRTKLRQAILGIAEKQKSRAAQSVLMDLSCSFGGSNNCDYSKLPMSADGFFLSQVSVMRRPNVPKRTLIELQLVSMAVTYYWLYCGMGDQQDQRSCMRYTYFLMEIAESYPKFEVAGDIRRGWYLTSDKQHLPPSWLNAEGGETV